MTENSFDGKPGGAGVFQWQRAIAAYHEPNRVRSLAELALTVAGLAICWAALYTGVRAGYPAAWLLVVPVAGFVIRLIMIQHDCSHRAFFRSARANDWVGRLIGIVALTVTDYQALSQRPGSSK
jgi:acyl-lipid omega-6 desaturase (Delta-12 desaturase)